MFGGLRALVEAMGWGFCRGTGAEDMVSLGPGVADVRGLADAERSLGGRPRRL